MWQISDFLLYNVIVCVCVSRKVISYKEIWGFNADKLQVGNNYAEILTFWLLPYDFADIFSFHGSFDECFMEFIQCS